MASFLLAIVSGLLYLQLSLASVAHATPVDLSTHRVYARPSPLLFTLKVSAPAGTAINGANISATNQTLYVIHPEGQGATCEGNQTHPNAATFYLWTNLHLLSTGDQVAYVMPSNSSVPGQVRFSTSSQPAVPGAIYPDWNWVWPESGNGPSGLSLNNSTTLYACPDGSSYYMSSISKHQCIPFEAFVETDDHAVECTYY